MKSAILASVVTAAQGAEYAVLVAGSNGFYNYRHQADVCHSYQVVRSKGIPAENIIVMAYDDIAGSGSNPFPGKLFNKPSASGVEGVDVYDGCKIDYSGSDVTPETFQAVLTGTASGKSLQSTAADNVFVFFSDHGAPGLIAFPSSEMYASDLTSTFDTMHSKKMYNKLTFYLETCESGSMFESLTTPGVYAVSAANPTESSWGTYCGSDAMVNGKSIGSCLGDLFSVSWMEDSDAKDITSETLSAQFSAVKSATAKSQVMQWGDLSFTSDMVSEFQGDSASNSADSSSKVERTGVSARDIDLQQAMSNYKTATSPKERLAMGQEMQRVLAEQIAVESAYESFLEIIYPGDAAKQADARDGKSVKFNKNCERAARDSFKQFGDFDSYTGFALQFHRYAVNVCADITETGMNVDVAQAAKQACTGATVV